MTLRAVPGAPCIDYNSALIDYIRNRRGVNQMSWPDIVEEAQQVHLLPDGNEWHSTYVTRIRSYYNNVILQSPKKKQKAAAAAAASAEHPY